jgi:hypothetical protein
MGQVVQVAAEQDLAALEQMEQSTLAVAVGVQGILAHLVQEVAE